MASLAAWFSSLGGLKIGARLTDDGSGLGEVGGEKPGVNIQNRIMKQDMSLAKGLLVLRDLRNLAVQPTGGG